MTHRIEDVGRGMVSCIAPRGDDDREQDDGRREAEHALTGTPSQGQKGSQERLEVDEYVTGVVADEALLERQQGEAEPQGDQPVALAQSARRLACNTPPITIAKAKSASGLCQPRPGSSEDIALA
jgi:hypothetical protein